MKQCDSHNILCCWFGYFWKEKELYSDETVKKNARTELHDRDSVFTDNFEPHNTSMSNNGKKTLEFMGKVNALIKNRLKG